MEQHAAISPGATEEQARLARRSARYEQVQMYLAWVRTIACLGVLAVVALALLRFGAQLTDTLAQANAAVASLNTVAAQLEQADLPAMLREVDALVAEAQVTMDAATRAMEGSLGAVESINLEELNAAISDFAAVVEPLARFFGR